MHQGNLLAVVDVTGFLAGIESLVYGCLVRLSRETVPRPDECLRHVLQNVKPKSVIIIRHGQSQFNADHSIRATVPDFKVELTPLGIEQARLAGDDIFDHWVGWESYGIWHAPFRRSEQTAVALNKSRLGSRATFFREDPRIREQEWGHLRSKEEADRIDAEREAYSKFWYRIPDGESGADVFDRVSTFMETLYRDFAKDNHPENLIISTHGYTSRIILMRWLHYTVAQFEEMPNPPNCGYYVLNLQPDGRYRLVRDPWDS